MVTILVLIILGAGFVLVQSQPSKARRTDRRELAPVRVRTDRVVVRRRVR